MTPAEFIGQHPEFKTALGIVPAFLAQATARVHAPTFGTRTEAAIGWLTCHLLAISPFGQTLRGPDGNGPDHYLAEFQAIRREVVVRTFVT